MSVELGTGRTNQKERTRTAIVTAAREAIASGGEASMPALAQRARVSEATAYRYFPDLASLLREALVGLWSPPDVAMAAVAHSTDPVERVAYATEVLLREVLSHEGAVRAMMSASILRPEAATLRPGRRFGLIDEALRPVAVARTATGAAALAQLRLDLAVVVSAEALFVLTDLCGLSPEDAIASTVRTASTLTAAAVVRWTPRRRATARS
jgi:AcrR family transcriptional regulator